MKFEVGQEIVEPIVRDQVAAAVAAQLGDPGQLMQNLVAKALERKVDRNGRVSQYSSDNKTPFLEQLAGKAIRDAAQAAIEKIVAEQQPVIQRAVEDHLRASPEATAAAIVAAFAEGAGTRYRTTVNLAFTPNSDI